MDEFFKMVNDNGVPITCAVVFIGGSLWLIRYLLKMVNSLGVRIGALELEYRNDLKKLIEKTTESVSQSNDLHREVILELRSCRDRRVVAEDRRMVAEDRRMITEDRRVVAEDKRVVAEDKRE